MSLVTSGIFPNSVPSPAIDIAWIGLCLRCYSSFRNQNNRRERQDVVDISRQGIDSPLKTPATPWHPSGLVCSVCIGPNGSESSITFGERPRSPRHLRRAAGRSAESLRSRSTDDTPPTGMSAVTWTETTAPECPSPVPLEMGTRIGWASTEPQGLFLLVLVGFWWDNSHPCKLHPNQRVTRRMVLTRPGLEKSANGRPKNWPLISTSRGQLGPLWKVDKHLPTDNKERLGENLKEVGGLGNAPGRNQLPRSPQYKLPMIFSSSFREREDTFSAALQSL
jgi:hypothetical protein